MAYEPVRLSGRYVDLVPLSHAYDDELAEAVRDGDLWKLWYTSVPEPDSVSDHIDRCLNFQAKGTMLPFTVIERATQAAVGMTTYLNIDPDVPRVEVGATWYARRVQRTALNTEAKLLLLGYAFDHLGCAAVEFRTHILNSRSRRAIERLGAKYDGVLRNHMRMRDGTLRDTCVYSITAPEWPAVRSHLNWLLSDRG